MAEEIAGAAEEFERAAEWLRGNCDGWGTCPTCEGLGFFKSRDCPECGIGVACPDCEGAGQYPQE